MVAQKFVKQVLNNFVIFYNFVAVFYYTFEKKLGYRFDATRTSSEMTVQNQFSNLGTNDDKFVSDTPENSIQKY